MTNNSSHAVRVSRTAPLGAVAAALLVSTSAFAVDYPVTPQQRSTAQQVAQAGVPLSELAPNAPDSHTVKRGDTLWDISKIFLKSPWRWPELWGMNLDQIRNPHLIYPGQILVLDKTGGRARLRVAQPVTGDTTKLSPRVRSESYVSPIASVPIHLLAPFINEAIVLNTDELASAPRIVATPEERVVVSRSDVAYVRGELGATREWRIFRQAKPVTDPTTLETLGFEAAFVGTADYTRAGEIRARPDGKPEIVPATVTITSSKLEVGVGDRLAPVPPRDFTNYAPRAPSQPIAGQIASIYGEGLQAGQHQVVALNRGARDGLERGHVLALWRDGQLRFDTTDSVRTQIKLPDERHGMLFVFRVFDRVSYALILNAQVPIQIGDRFTQP